jgi:hypothetical protein
MVWLGFPAWPTSALSCNFFVSANRIRRHCQFFQLRSFLRLTTFLVRSAFGRRKTNGRAKQGAPSSGRLGEDALLLHLGEGTVAQEQARGEKMIRSRGFRIVSGLAFVLMLVGLSSTIVSAQTKMQGIIKGRSGPQIFLQTNDSPRSSSF